MMMMIGGGGGGGKGGGFDGDVDHHNDDDDDDDDDDAPQAQALSVQWEKLLAPLHGLAHASSTATRGQNTSTAPTKVSKTPLNTLFFYSCKEFFFPF
jgi:hypothetical protein